MYTVYYRPDCPFSRQAILLLKRHVTDIKHDLNLIDVKAEKLNLLDELRQHGITYHRTVPAIFLDEHFIGGCQQLESFLRNNPASKIEV